MNKQKGFTLVELVVVIVILGIMAAVALPRFVDLGPQAHNAAAAGVAGALASATSTNYASRKAGALAGTQPITDADVCNSAASIVALGSLISGSTLQSGVSASNSVFQVGGVVQSCVGAANDGVARTCTITPNGTGVTGQSATIICSQ